MVGDAATLLLGRDGNCFAWSELFAASFRAAGAKLTPMESVVVRPVGLFGTQRERLQINDWFFDPEAIGNGTEVYPSVNMSRYPENPEVYMAKNAQGQWQSVWGPNEAANDMPGAAGQNIADPLSLFFNHAMIKIGGVYYDPSYGKTYASRQAWEDQAVAGFMVFDAPGKRFLSRQNPSGPGVAADTEESLEAYNGGPLPPTPP